jgi:glycerophosphoryl diester phosphodiesterase
MKVLAAKPTIIASQGGAGLMPQNTLAAIANASVLGADGSEIDIHLTRDLEMVLHHDYRLSKDIARGQDGKWLSETGPALAEMTLSAIRDYDVGRKRPGSSIAMRYPDQAPCDGEVAPTLQEVFDLYARLEDTHSQLWIEPKSDPFDNELRAACVEEFADKIVDAIERTNFVSRAVVICFDWRLLQRVQTANPNIQTGFLTINPEALLAVPAFEDEGRRIERALTGPAPWPAIIGFDEKVRIGRPWEAVAETGGTYWAPYFSGVTPEAIEAAHLAGVKVSTWGVEDPDDFTKCITLGFDSVTTARPNKFL